jgi:hypothetical protein
MPALTSQGYCELSTSDRLLLRLLRPGVNQPQLARLGPYDLAEPGADPWGGGAGTGAGCSRIEELVRPSRVSFGLHRLSCTVALVQDVAIYLKCSGCKLRWANKPLTLARCPVGRRFGRGLTERQCDGDSLQAGRRSCNGSCVGSPAVLYEWNVKCLIDDGSGQAILHADGGKSFVVCQEATAVGDDVRGPDDWGLTL